MSLRSECADHATARQGVVPAVHFNELERALFWAARGMRMVSIGSEAGHLVGSGKQAVSALAAVPVG